MCISIMVWTFWIELPLSTHVQYQLLDMTPVKGLRIGLFTRPGVADEEAKLANP